jgi:hypothetical protein
VSELAAIAKFVKLAAVIRAMLIATIPKIINLVFVDILSHAATSNYNYYFVKPCLASCLKLLISIDPIVRGWYDPS